MEASFALAVWFALCLIGVRNQEPDWSWGYSLLVSITVLCILTIGGLAVWYIGKFLLSPLWWLVHFFLCSTCSFRLSSSSMKTVLVFPAGAVFFF